VAQSPQGGEECVLVNRVELCLVFVALLILVSRSFCCFEFCTLMKYVGQNLGGLIQFFVVCVVVDFDRASWCWVF